MRKLVSLLSFAIVALTFQASHARVQTTWETLDPSRPHGQKIIRTSQGKSSEISIKYLAGSESLTTAGSGSVIFTIESFLDDELLVTRCIATSSFFSRTGTSPLELKAFLENRKSNADVTCVKGVEDEDYFLSSISIR